MKKSLKIALLANTTPPRQSIIEILKPYGFEIFEYIDPDILCASACIQKINIIIIFSDYIENMEKIDLFSGMKNIKLIILTNHACEKITKFIKKYNNCITIQKPHNSNNILAAIRKTL